MNAALRGLGHTVDEIWREQLPHRIRHGNLHYVLELPSAYRDAVRKAITDCDYDVIELNQPHAYLAARDHRRRGRAGVFVNRSHGHEVRSEERLEDWKQRLGVPRRAGWRGAASRVMRRLLDRQWELIARGADGFVVSCREDADFLVDRYQVVRDRIGIITQGVAAAFLTRPAPPLDAERLRRLLYVGQYGFFKAPMILAEAVQRVLSQQPLTTFTWVCHAAHHSTVRELFAPELRPRVSLQSWVSQEELISIYDRHGIFLFPSFFEGFGKAPLEAMSRGLVVVASETGGMRDFILPQENGLLCPVGDSAQLASRVLELLRNARRCQDLSAGARRTAAEHTWSRCAQDAVRFYTELLQRRAKRQERRGVAAGP
jgi:glycosyltransferase involved in cell wall biosynthesis